MGCSTSSQISPSKPTRDAASANTKLTFTLTTTYMFPNGTKMSLFPSDQDMCQHPEANQRKARETSIIRHIEASDQNTSKVRETLPTLHSRKAGSMSSINKRPLTSSLINAAGTMAQNNPPTPLQLQSCLKQVYECSKGNSSLNEIIRQSPNNSTPASEEIRINCYLPQIEHTPVQRVCNLDQEPPEYREVPRCPIAQHRTFFNDHKDQSPPRNMEVTPSNSKKCAENSTPRKRDQFRMRFGSAVNILDRIRSARTGHFQQGYKDLAQVGSHKREGAGSADEPNERLLMPVSIQQSILDSPTRKHPSILQAIESCETKNLNMSDLFEVSDPEEEDLKKGALSPQYQNSPTLAPPLQQPVLIVQRIEEEDVNSLIQVNKSSRPKLIPREGENPLAEIGQVRGGLVFSNLPQDKECKSATVRETKPSKRFKGIKIRVQ